MDVICIATTDGRAYYSIINRLKLTGLVFRSYTPSAVSDQDCALIVTTTRELKSVHGNAIAIEELDENPVIMKAQILARLNRGKRDLLVGIDPGLRIGVAVFYQNVKLVSSTFSSIDRLLNMLEDMVESIPHSKFIVKVGGGAPRLSTSVARTVGNTFADAIVEIVDERGTSNRQRQKQLTRDQLAAVRIAYRKGVPLLTRVNRLS